MTIRISGHHRTVDRACRLELRCHRMRQREAKEARRQQRMTCVASYRDSSSPCVFRNRTAANSPSSYGHAARLNACGSHAATLSLETDVDHAAADVKSGRLEAIDHVGKSRVDCDRAAVGGDGEAR